MIADVGPGRISKTVDMETGYQCPKLVNQTNWMDGHTWPDTYSVDQTPNTIKVTRTDSTDGWAMNLRFQCCKGRIFILLFYFFLSYSIKDD